MDQSIGIAGVGAFGRAVFFYRNRIDEVVDNVTFETVPEPGALALLTALPTSSLCARGSLERVRRR